jgi:lipoprotein-anchoring transpeptidase ErfK/SrfK
VTPEDNLYRAEEVRILTQATEVPEGVGENDKWIDVDLEHQTLVAYEGLRPVYATLVSTGRVRDPDDPNRDMRTPSGLFRITSKHVSHTMDGDHATDGPYSIEDVPYVMYFQLAFALHSAFWHDGFGRPRSHGCVNLSPLDARWIFNWAGPTLPQNWHMVAPRDDNPATWVYIHGETPEG